MAGFSIDDVRESFSQDISMNLGLIAEAARGLRGPDGMQLLALLELNQARLDRVAVASHAIAGTASLVGASSLSSSGRLIEEFAEKGLESMRELHAHVQRLVWLSEVCDSGAAKLKSMLDLELDGERAEAAGLAAAWEVEVIDAVPVIARPTAGDAMSTSYPMAATGDESEDGEDFDFEAFDEQAGAGPDAVDELLTIFRQEAREGLVTLQGYLHLLVESPRDEGSLKQVERIYHTLKGAALAIGLEDVGALAKDLQVTLEAVLDGSQTVDRAFLDKLAADTNAMFRLAGVPELAPIRGVKSLQGSGGRRFFSDEARQTLDDARVLARQLPAAAAERAAELRTQIARLLHRLKGSALLVDAAPLAEAASELRTACNSQAASAAMIEHGLARLEGLLARLVASESSVGDPSSEGSVTSSAGALFDRASGSTTTAAPSASSRAASAPSNLVRAAVTVAENKDLFEAFEMECGELFEGIERDLVRLASSDRPRADLEQLMRSFHTLKGALYAVGMTPVGQTVHLVEDFLEELPGLAVLPPLRPPSRRC